MPLRISPPPSEPSAASRPSRASERGRDVAPLRSVPPSSYLKDYSYVATDLKRILITIAVLTIGLAVAAFILR